VVKVENTKKNIIWIKSETAEGTAF